MHCSIFKGSRTPDTYLFVPAREVTDAVPGLVLQRFGALEHVMDLVLTPDKRLARVEARTVLRALLTQGCFIQLPPSREDQDQHSWRDLSPVGASDLPE